MLLIVSIILFLTLPVDVFASEPVVVINEFVVDSDIEWVELFVSGYAIEDIKTYWIDDDSDFMDDAGSGKRKQLSDLITGNSTFPVIEMRSFFNNSGDGVVLFNTSGEIVDQFSYDTNPGKGISIGRSPDGTGAFSTLSGPTKGSHNSAVATPTPTITPSPTNMPTPTKKPAPTKSPTPPDTPTPAIPSPEKTRTASDASSSALHEGQSRTIAGAHHQLDTQRFAAFEEEGETYVASTSADASRTIRTIFFTGGTLSMAGMMVSAYMIRKRALQISEDA